MSTGEVSGSNHPGPSNEPEKRENERSKIERSSIRPSEINDPEVGQMVQSVKGKKRVHSPEKKTSTELPPKKVLKDILKDLSTLVEECFGKKIEKAGGSEEIAKQCFEFAAERLRSFERLTWDEISKIQNLLYGSELESFSSNAASAEVDLINPHPAYVFKSLYESILPLYQYESFDEVVQARNEYIRKFPVMNVLLSLGVEKRKSTLNELTQMSPEIVELFNRCPVFTAFDLFGGHNTHRAYVLRGIDFQPTWVFKPTAVVHEGGLLSLDSNSPYSLSVSERVACMVNYHHGFPIPATYLIEVNGSVGSIQIFINNSESYAKKNAIFKTEAMKIEFEKLLIFDLLFANKDRHEENILAQIDCQKIFGIDNGEIINDDGKPLKIEFLDIFSGIFSQEALGVVSDDHLERYRRVLTKVDASDNLVQWMNSAALMINSTTEKSLKNIAMSLIKEFDEKHGI